MVLTLAALQAPLGAALSAALLPRYFDTALDTSNGLAQNGRDFCTPIEPPLTTPPLLDGGECSVIVAMYGQTKSEIELMRRLIPSQCDIILYDKDDVNEPCSIMPLSGISKCIPLPNVGREQHTWAYHVSMHYEDLPDYLFMIPADLPAHDRAHSVQVMLNSTIFNQTRPGGQTGEGFWCINKSAGKLCDGFKGQDMMNLDVCQGCTMTKYCRGGNESACVRPDPASPSPLGSWIQVYTSASLCATKAPPPVAAASATPPLPPSHLPRTSLLLLLLLSQAHIGQYSPDTMNRMCNLQLCHYGVAATTKQNLLGHPKEVYESIVNTLNKGIMPESIWFMEWVPSAPHPLQLPAPTLVAALRPWPILAVTAATAVAFTQPLPPAPPTPAPLPPMPTPNTD